jgi:sugar lactone lactonase YvrE
MKNSKRGFALRRKAAAMVPLVVSALAAGCGGSSDWCVEWGNDPYDHGKWNHPKGDPPANQPGNPPGATGLNLIAGDQCKTCTGSADGTGSTARFAGAEGIASDGHGNLFVVDKTSSIIRRVTAQGVVTTIAGSSGQPGSSDGVGSSARFRAPTRVTADSAGNLYVTDTGNSTIRKISATGSVSTIGGRVGTCGSSDGGAGSAQFCSPEGIALDQSGNLWVADTQNNTIRRIDPAGNVTTVAGQPGACGSADGQGIAATFCRPRDITVDRWNNVYVADTANSTIRMIDPKGKVTTLAGAPGSCSSADGPTGSSRLCSPAGITVDNWDNLYVADTGNSTIRRIDVNNVTTTVAGVPQQHQIILGPLPGGLDAPLGVAMENDQSVALTSHNLVLRLLPPQVK